ncbi:MAG: MlaD family protein [Chthoniobacterales bacterium]
MSAQPDKSDPQDHGEVVHGRGGFSAAWIFPLIALAAAGWMFYQHLESRGPEIEIWFKDAPGIEEGKTPLIYRGVVAGKVVDVRLDDGLTQAVVKIRLEKFAAELAVDTTDFWVERPMLSLQGVSGLTSLIQGNSIRARMGTGDRRLYFVGHDKMPVLDIDQTALGLRLESEEIQPLERGAPVTFRGILVGRVRDQSLSAANHPFIDLEIEESKKPLIKTSTRFWLVPATSVTLGPGGIKLELSGLDALIQGGIACDDFGVPGGQLESGSTVALLPNEELARASGPSFIINFPQASGVHAGQTRLRYLGLPVGMVTAVQALDGKAEVTAQFEPKYDFLRRSGATFTLITPTISLKGVSGLETLITGVTIDCTPGGGGGEKSNFIGAVSKDFEDKALAQSEAGRPFRLVAEQSALGVGAPVLYRQMQVGAVLAKKLGRDGRTVELTIGIEDRYRNVVRDNSVFWEERGIRGSIGFIGISVQTVAPLPFVSNGAVALATPDIPGPAAPANAFFTLYDKPKRDWLKWGQQPTETKTKSVTNPVIRR